MNGTAEHVRIVSDEPTSSGTRKGRRLLWPECGSSTEGRISISHQRATRKSATPEAKAESRYLLETLLEKADRDDVDIYDELEAMAAERILAETTEWIPFDQVRRRLGMG